MNKNIFIKLLSITVFVAVFGLAQTASAALYYQANGGSYWSQSGSSWNYKSNDGYCVSGRGPCGSNLWYQQWTYNHAGCGYDEQATWRMSTVVP